MKDKQGEKVIKSYARGSYNKFDWEEQWIRLSEGCPNNCEFCRETKECGKLPIYFDIPKIVRNHVKILDMNLMYKDKAVEIINSLGSKKVDVLKVWNVKVNDCWFDNQLSPNIKPLFWSEIQIKDFRKKCRKHNQLVLFGIDPEYKKKGFDTTLQGVL